jgi:hypothetical protein
MQLFMKISIKNQKPGQQKLLRFEESLTKSFRNPFFLIAVFLVAACSPELQEQEGVVERVANPVESKFEKWYEAEHKEILEPPSNARMQFDPSVRLTYRYKEVDWSSYKKLNLPSKLEIYEFDFLAPNLVVPFDFKEEFGYEEALKRSKQTLLIFAQGNEVVKSYVIRYYFSGDKAGIADFQKVNYDAVDKNWKGQIDLYSLNEIHLVSFDMVIGQVIGTETMKLGSQDDIHPSQSASTTCTTIWTEGPCEPISGETGIVCYDTFTTYCYNTSPPLISGFPAWNGSGGFAPGGSGGPADQSICDFDPTCIPHPDSQVNPDEQIEGFYDEPVDFIMESNPGSLDWQNSSSSERFVHMINHIYAAKLAGNSTINIRNIFSNWPSNFQSSGPIKSGWANLNFNGVVTKVYYEIPVIEPWSIINSIGQRTINGNNQCAIEYAVSHGNLRAVYMVLSNSSLCTYYENLLL